MITLVGFRQQQQVVKLRLYILAKLLIGGEVYFAAVNRLNLLAGFLLNGCARIAQLGNARHNAMIADRHRGHVKLRSATDHIFDMRQAVEQ